MAYIKKKIPREVRWLRERLERVEYIDEHSGLRQQELLKGGRNLLEEVQQTVTAYNSVLSQADELRDKINEQVRLAQDIHERLRMAVIGEYGQDSREYRLMGGVPKSEIDYSRKNGGSEEE